MKSRVIFLLAIIMSVITTLLFFNYLGGNDSPETTEEQYVNVVVANQVIEENQVISTDMVGIKQIPSQHVHPSAVTTIEDVDGMFTITTIEQGEIILSHRLKNQEEETRIISRKITNGSRAVSIGVNIVQSVSNLVQPEDYVDVIFTRTGNGDDTTSTTQLLTSVRVLAIGQKLQPVTNEQEPSTEYSSITLELKPSEAVTLIEASENGSIHLTLHSSIAATD